MILYWDTSALIKLYIEESHSDEARQAFASANFHACHVIGLVEFNAAIARLHRQRILNDGDYSQVKDSFIHGWTHYLRIPASQPVLKRASELAEIFALRAYDSVHLAAAEMAATQSSEDLTFACYDMALNRAAGTLGLALI